MSFLNDDLDSFFGDFNITATVNGVDIEGIFDSDYASVNYASGVESYAPQFECKTSDIVDIALSDTLTINGVAYTAVEIKSDGTGLSVIRLHE